MPAHTAYSVYCFWWWLIPEPLGATPFSVNVQLINRLRLGLIVEFVEIAQLVIVRSSITIISPVYLSVFEFITFFVYVNSQPTVVIFCTLCCV